MGVISLRAFDYGEITDGDTHDLNLRSAKKLLNVDIDRGVGLVRSRDGYSSYVDIDPMQDTNGGPIPSGTHVFHEIIPFQTGQTTTQNNTLIITSNPARTEFTIYSNAPTGGNGNTYKKFETKSATSCMAKVVNGVAYIAFDNTVYHRVHYSLYDLYGASRSYFAGNVTVNSGTSTAGTIGSGGIIHNGFIYDEHRLYGDGATEGVTFVYTGAVTISGSHVGLPAGRFSVFATPVFDGDPDQYGIPAFPTSGGSAVQVIELLDTNKYLNFEVTVSSSTTFNRRLKRVEVFCQYSSIDNSSVEADYSSVCSIDINNGVSAPWTGAWTASGGGYKVTVTLDGRMYRNFTTVFWTQISGGRPISHTLADISVKATRLAHVKERMFAIGTENDLGGEKIRHTSMGWGGKGTRDVWWKLNTFWKEGGYKINDIREWRGRLYFFQDVNSYYMDVAQRQIPTPWPLDYKTDESGYGFGTEIIKTISVCPEGILYANYQSIFLLDGETPIDILDEKKKSLWDAISNTDKLLAVGRYNAYRNSYWIKVRNGSTWEIWIYNLAPRQKNWRTYSWARVDDEPLYFFRDFNNKFVFSAATILYEYEKRGGGNTITDNGLPIACEVQTQHIELNTLSNNLVYRLKARLKNTNTGAYGTYIRFVRDEENATVPNHVMVLQKYNGFTSIEFDGPQTREMNLRCKSLQLKISFAPIAATEHYELKQLDLMHTSEGG